MKLLQFICLLVLLGIAVVAPVAAQETLSYWGDDGADMAFRMDTRYLRFYEFPILVYMPETPDPAWSVALDEALLQLSEIVDIQRTFDPAAADITVTVLWGNAYLAQCPQGTLGCSSIKPIRNPDRSVSVVGTVTLLYDNSQKAFTVMHELIHALGIAGHSPHPEDVMYYNNQYAPALLTERDRNTLEILYAAPGLQDDRPRD